MRRGGDQQPPPHQWQRRQRDQLAEDRGEAPQDDAEVDLQEGPRAVGHRHARHYPRRAGIAP
jgi:hypothetical protein